jgi:hypothetical protein
LPLTIKAAHMKLSHSRMPFVRAALSRWLFRQSPVEQKSSDFRLFRTEQIRQISPLG